MELARKGATRPGILPEALEGDELRLTSRRMRIGGQEGHTKFVWKRVES